MRTIYIKFGSKAGLLSALITRRRTRYTAHLGDLASDTRPLLIVLTDFGMRFLELVSAPESIALQRMAIIESRCNPELGHTAYRSGFAQTYPLLSQFFERPDIRAQLRDRVNLQQVPALLISCVMGDPLHLLSIRREAIIPIGLRDGTRRPPRTLLTRCAALKQEFA